MAVDKSSIEWTDSTWSPVTGCTKVSPGCDNCYAEGIARRFSGSKAFPNGFEVTLHPERLDQPLRWKKPRRIFVNSMSDLFHNAVPDSYIARVFAVMALAPQHTFQILTKRHGRMRSVLRDECRCGGGHAPSIHLRSAMSWAVSKANPDRIHGVPDDAEHRVYFEAGWPLPNVWLGVSVEDQQRADLRIPALLETPAAVRFVSAEPLLGPVNLSRWMGALTCGCGGEPGGAALGSSARCMEPEPSTLDWVIVGGESGPGARPMHPDWVRGLRDQCEASGVSFFMKQWGEYIPESLGAQVITEGTAKTARYADLAGGHRPANVGARNGAATCHRVGKKAAGRELDGRTWDEFPAAVATGGA